MDLKKTLQKALSNLIPIKRITISNPKYETQAIANLMDADRIHQVISSAQVGDTRDLFALYRDIVIMDSHLQGEFTKRKLAVLGDPLAILAVDKTLPDDVAAAARVKAMLTSCPGWFMACSHLLDSTLWPVAVVEKVYSQVASATQRLAKASKKSALSATAVMPPRYQLSDLIPVPHQLLDFTTGFLRVRDTDPHTGMPLTSTHEADPNRYIIHRGHLLSTPDNWGGPMRSLIFWWLLGAMDRDWWGRFLDRYGSPFLLGKYESDDDAGRNILEQAFRYAVKIGGLVVSKETEVEIKEAASGNTGEAYEKFLTICQREKSKLILGQTLSADAQPTGLGSGVATGHEAVRQDIRRFDATLLGNTLREQLAAQFLQINQLPGNPPTINWGAESSADSASLATLLVNLSLAGLQVADASIASVGERIGLQLERKPASAPFAGLTALSVADQKTLPRAASAALDSISREGSAGLAQAFRGSLAPIRRIVMESRSADECETRIREFCADWNPARISALLAEALEAFAGNGASVAAKGSEVDKNK
jgi:phage gp29-like protein